MLKLYRPSQVLNPSLTILGSLFLGGYFYESHPTLVVILWAALIGIYVGAWWQSEHEQWTKSIWKYFEDGIWISDRARECYAERANALMHWIILLFFYSLFAAFTLFIGGLWIKYGMIGIGSYAKENGISFWMTIPLGFLSALLATVIPLIPFMAFGKIVDSDTFLGRGKKLLKSYENLDNDELPKLVAYRDEKNRLIALAKTIEWAQEKT